MNSVRKTIFGIIAAVISLAFVPQIALAGTVVAASGPSASQYPVGTRLSDTQRVTLREGDTLTVLQDGRTRTLRGPGTFVLAQRAPQGRNRALAALTTRRAADRARTGAVRGDGEEVTNPNLWYVDVSVSGTVCLANADPVRLWRARTEDAAVYTFSREGASEEPAQLIFPEREMLAMWESAVQLREGEMYTISSTVSDDVAQVRFVFLQEIPEDPEDLALALIENGCTVQLEQMSQALAAS
ncbi:hypothetical protein [Aurantiacibacter marinus]|uniref:DUF4412 domain-containing protein n=1 Tax=Aurantiacibacter marinus TaxID=874156 RepID=A0A0H0XT88_9SPHN|nr:hypothetical protein [Aurantiacibacter marinus]KLI65172.1 hypothetical protein AAV99_02570 [Aurantiacibacter marinus]